MAPWVEKFLVLVLGLGLFFAGWMSVEHEAVPGEIPDEVRIVIRPVNAELQAGGKILKVSDELGEASLKRVKKLRLSRPSWEETIRSIGSEEVLAVRCTAPRAKFDPKTENGTKVQLKQLPDKDKIEREGAVFRLPAGPYEFLAEAEGHIPDRVSVDLKPGALKTLEVELKALPTFRPPALPPATRPSPPPTYRPPPRYTSPRPRPRPRPRFTPISKPRPAPRPPAPAPAPFFTPVP